MTKRSPQTTNILNIFQKHHLIKQGVSLIGSVGILSSGLAIAQTEPSTNSVVIPVTPAPAPAPSPAPAPKTIVPPPALIKTPKPSVNRVPVSAPRTFVRPTPVQIPVQKPVAPTNRPPVNTVTPKKVELSAPRISTSSSPRVTNQQRQTVSQPTVIWSKPGKNSYIDNTNYNRGATGKYTGPPSVILKERSTGCRTVLQGGNVNGGTCSVRVTPKNTRVPQRTLSSQQWQGNTRRNRPVRSYSKRNQVNNNPNTSSTQTKAAPKYNRATNIIKYIPGGNTALLFPLSIPATITSAFGWRIHPIRKTRRLHTGTDIGAPMGTPVLAAYPGKVAVASSLKGYGLTVILRHENNTQESRYAHLSEIFVQPGIWVDQGTVIGLVGSTGLSTGPHLHFEWRHNTKSGWVAVDAGAHLAYAMENLIQAIRMAEVSSNPES